VTKKLLRHTYGPTTQWLPLMDATDGAAIIGPADATDVLTIGGEAGGGEGARGFAPG